MMRNGGVRTFYRHGRIALKDLPAHFAVDIDVPTGKPGADTDCYLILVDYLSGCNSSHRPVVLHAPVQQAADDEWQLTEKTASLEQQMRTSIRFEFSNGPFLSEFPEPTDPRVRLHKVAASRLATIWFAGGASVERVASEADRLRDFIALKDLSPLATSAPPAVRATRCGPFRLLTELSIPIAQWQTAGKIRSSHAVYRDAGIGHARSRS